MLTQLIYVSRPFGFDTSTLAGILLDARRKNRQDEITGALICRSDIYLQLLEGPRTAIDAVYRRITADDRHLDIQRLLTTDIVERLFPQWDMLDDPARSWLWSPQQVNAGDVALASSTALLAVFERVAREVTQTGDQLVDSPDADSGR